MSILASMFTGWLELITLVANGLVVPPSELGLANGVFGSARQVGGSIAGKGVNQYLEMNTMLTQFSKHLRCHLFKPNF
jgi:hypothetical protein